MGDDSQILIGVGLNEADVLDLKAAIREVAVEGGEELERLAKGGDGNARKLLLDTEEAQQALQDIEDEFKQTGRTSEETLKRAEEAAKRVAAAYGFEPTGLKLIPPELEKVSKASRDAGAAVESFGVKAESGSKGTQRAAAQARLAVDRLEAAIAELRTSGGPVPPEWEARLASYREGLKRGTEAAGRFAKAQKEVQDELGASTERAAAFDQESTNLTEGLLKRMPKAQAAFVGFTASVATLRESYQTTREYVDFIKEHFGVDIDAGVKKATLAVLDYIEAQEKSRRITSQGTFIAEEVELEKNAANISTELRRRQGESLDDLRERIDNFRGGVRKLIQEQYEANEATRKFLEGAAGVKVEELEERIKEVSNVLRNFGGDFEKLKASGILPQFGAEVDSIAEILRKFGPALRETLGGKELEEFDKLLATFRDGVKDKLQATADYAEEAARRILAAFGVQTPEAIRKSVDSLRSLVEAFGGLSKTTSEQAAQVAVEADKILKSIALLPAEQRKSLADISASLHATSDAYRKHAEAVTSFAASGTEAIEKATAARLAAWDKEKAALQGLVDSAGTAEAALLKTLEKPKQSGDRGATDSRSELADLKLKPIQTEEDLARIEELQAQLGGLREKQEAARAGSEEVAGAIGKFRDELKATGTALTKLDQEGITVLLSRLQQTAERSGATASQIREAFAGVDTIVSMAQQRAAELNGSAAAAEAVARQAAGTARALGDGTQNVVASVDEAGQVLISSLEDVRKGSEVVKATLDDAATSGAEWSRATKESGAAVDALVLGADGLAAGMERVSQETAKAGEGLREIQDKGEGAGEALKLLSSHAGDAAGPVARVADGLKAVAASAEPLHSSADAVHSMSRDAPGLARDLSQLEPATATQKRADAYGALAVNLKACAVAAGQLKANLPGLQFLRDEAEALKAVAAGLEAVAAGLEAERAAREGEGAPN